MKFTGRNRIALPNFLPPDAGGAGGTVDPGAGGAGGVEAPIYKLTDDARVDLGDGKAVSWKEARESRYVEKDRYERGVQYLQGEALRLEKAWADYHKGVGAKPQQAAPSKSDILDEIKDLSVVDGATVARIIKSLREDGLGPQATLLAQMWQKQQQMEKQLGSASKQASAASERDTNAQFETKITTALTSIAGIKGLPDGVSVDGQNPTLREIAKDVYMSHDQNSWRAGEFEKMLGQRLEGLIAFVRTLDAKAVEAARERRGKFLNPSRGGARPSGDAPYKHRNGSQMAEMLFGQLDGSRT